jgi:predicted NBD/HSP70 family sugar kinase
MTPARRSRNEERLLALIPHEDGLTVAELVRLSGMSRPALAELLNRLRADGAVMSERAPVPGARGRGRPALRWRRPRPQGLFGAVALSRDAVRVRVADAADRRTAEREQRMNVSLDARGALTVGRALLDECLTAVGGDEASLTSAVLGLPCAVGDDGRPQARGILPDWVGFRPREQLRAWLPGIPIAVENDANLAALGELAHGAGRGRGDMIYVKLAPGVGAALVIGGRLYRGAGGLAGELGHVQINDMGRPCVCGTRGCLAVELYAAALHGTDGENGLLAVTELFRRRDAGDATAGRIIGHIGLLLGEQLGALANALDPEQVVISTDAVPPHPVLLDGVREGIRRAALPVVCDLPVVASPLGIRAELLGGIALAQERSQRTELSASKAT